MVIKKCCKVKAEKNDPKTLRLKYFQPVNPDRINSKSPPRMKETTLDSVFVQPTVPATLHHVNDLISRPHITVIPLVLAESKEASI